MSRIALIITGHLRSSVSEDYDVLLSKGMMLPKSAFTVFDLDADIDLPDSIDLDGIVISGSAKMLNDSIKWLDKICEWLRLQETRNVPMLGICFGHQLLAHAFGGKVADNPNGIEVGTKTIYFNETARDDALFSEYYPKISAQVSHVQSVVKLPENTTVLGYSDQDQFQVFRMKQNIWGLQFHPEFTADIIRKLIISKEEKYPGMINVNKLISEVEETPISYSILDKFGELIDKKN